MANRDFAPTDPFVRTDWANTVQVPYTPTPIPPEEDDYGTPESEVKTWTCLMGLLALHVWLFWM
jgi:hypothetical protein